MTTPPPMPKGFAFPPVLKSVAQQGQGESSYQQLQSLVLLDPIQPQQGSHHIQLLSKVKIWEKIKSERRIIGDKGISFSNSFIKQKSKWCIWNSLSRSKLLSGFEYLIWEQRGKILESLGVSSSFYLPFSPLARSRAVLASRVAE